MYLQAWRKLTFAKQMQICKSYGIKNYGTTEAQLDFELSTKLPVGMLGADEVGEPPVSTEKEPEVETITEEVKEPSNEQTEAIEAKPKRGRRKK